MAIVACLPPTVKLSSPSSRPPHTPSVALPPCLVVQDKIQALHEGGKHKIVVELSCNPHARSIIAFIFLCIIIICMHVYIEISSRDVIGASSSIIGQVHMLRIDATANRLPRACSPVQRHLLVESVLPFHHCVPRFRLLHPAMCSDTVGIHRPTGKRPDENYESHIYFSLKIFRPLERLQPDSTSIMIDCPWRLRVHVQVLQSTCRMANTNSTRCSSRAGRQKLREQRRSGIRQ